MADDDDDLITEAIRAANTDEEQPVAEAEVEEVDDYQGEEEEGRVFAGKFNDIDALEDAYLELQRKFHESRQPEYEEEEEEEYEEAPQFFGQEPSTQEELVSFAEQNPSGAAMWVIQNVDGVPEDLANAVLEHWWTQRPWEATQYWFEQRLEAERDQIESMTNPLVEQHERALMAEAYENLIEEVPDFHDYQERVEEFVDQYDVTGLLPPGSESDPVALAEGIGTIVGILKWREYQDAMRNQGMMIPDHEETPPPKVSTKNTTVAGDMDSDEMDDMIRNMILNA